MVGSCRHHGAELSPNHNLTSASVLYIVTSSAGPLSHQLSQYAAGTCALLVETFLHAVKGLQLWRLRLRLDFNGFTSPDASRNTSVQGENRGCLTHCHMFSGVKPADNHCSECQTHLAFPFLYFIYFPVWALWSNAAVISLPPYSTMEEHISPGPRWEILHYVFL